MRMGPSARALHELLDIGVAGRVDVLGIARPDDLAFIDHRRMVADGAQRVHVVGDRERGGAQRFRRI